MVIDGFINRFAKVAKLLMSDRKLLVLGFVNPELKVLPGRNREGFFELRVVAFDSVGIGGNNFRLFFWVFISPVEFRRFVFFVNFLGIC